METQNYFKFAWQLDGNTTSETYTVIYELPMASLTTLRPYCNIKAQMGVLRVNHRVNYFEAFQISIS